jgi:hypothetical protein
MTNLQYTVEFQQTRGLRGPAGDASFVNAQEIVGKDRALTADGFHCTPLTLDLYAGISLTSGTPPDVVGVKRYGFFRIDGAAFLINRPIYIGPNGTLIQTRTSPISRRIGWAVSHQTINLDVYPSIGE